MPIFSTADNTAASMNTRSVYDLPIFIRETLYQIGATDDLGNRTLGMNDIAPLMTYCSTFGMVMPISEYSVARSTGCAVHVVGWLDDHPVQWGTRLSRKYRKHDSSRTAFIGIIRTLWTDHTYAQYR